MRWLIAILMSFMVLPIPALAESSFTCVDEDSLNEFAEIEINNETTTINETRLCPHGCSEDLERCKPNGVVRIILLGIAVAIILGGVLLSMRMRNIFSVILLIFIATATLILAFVDIFSGGEITILLVLGLFVLTMFIVLMKDVLEDGRNVSPLDDEE